ncbi:MAG: hypothetical protein LAO06_08780 [Acidobacteriia bacterium]|nr:hypothetical protein [Terriglobia bacterium]
MNCAEFQKVLPYIIETGGNTEEERHLRECLVCSDLVEDLKYIVEQAKLLVPMEDPSPRVWEEIKASLEREGRIKRARLKGRLLGPIPWIGALGAIILVAFAAFLVERGRQQQASASVENTTPPLQTISLNTVPTEQDDEQLLQQVAASRPSSASAYQSNLDQVNASIADAKRTLEQNPDDEDARQSLIRAYQQKALLYELAAQ